MKTVGCLGTLQTATDKASWSWDVWSLWNHDCNFRGATMAQIALPICQVGGHYFERLHYFLLRESVSNHYKNYPRDLREFMKPDFQCS